MQVIKNTINTCESWDCFLAYYIYKIHILQFIIHLLMDICIVSSFKLLQIKQL